MTNPTIRIALADDSLLLREGLERLFAEAGFEPVGAFGDADSLHNHLDQCTDETRPEVVVLDVRMPPTFRDEGVRAAIEFRKRWPHLGILLLSQYVESVYARELLASGAEGLGYLLKDRVYALTELHDAVVRIAAGGTVLDPEVISQLFARRADPLTLLTPREREVMQAMAEGRSNGAIAQTLGIGLGAVEKNVRSIFGKLGLEESGSEHRRVLAVLSWLER